MERLCIFDDPKRFWSEVSPSLKKEEAKNSLCLGLSYIFRSEPSDCLYQSALFRNGELLGSLVLSRHRTNHNLLPSPTSDAETARKLYDEFQKANLPVTGIVGERTTANLFKSFFEVCGMNSRVKMVQGLYRCEKVRMPRCGTDLNFRVADDRDIEKLGEWIEAFHHEAVPHDPPVNGVEFAKAKVNQQAIYVIEKNAELVSMAAWGRDIETSCSVNLVYTPKPLRKNGYASVVTAKLTQLLLSKGKKEINLYTDMTNPTSNKIYMNVGYEFVCDSVHYGLYLDTRKLSM